MSDYIEREALIAEFKRMKLGENSLVEKFFADAVYAVLSAFHAADVVPASKWIKCEDKLPPFDEDVLMLFESNMAVGYLREKDFWCVWLDNGYVANCETGPTYWMPLPERPKE